MKMVLVLVLVLVVIFGVCSRSSTDFRTDYVGKGVYLPSQSYLSPSPDVQVLELVEEGIQKTVIDKSYYEYTMFDNQVSFYSYASVQTNVGIKFSYNDWTFGISLEDVYSSATYYKYEVKGVSNHYIHSYADYVLKQDHYKFDQKALSEINLLPSVIDDPHLSSSWESYDYYLSNFGSHVLIGGVQGSRLETFSMASSEVQYTDKQFKIKSCLDLEGPLPLNFSISICSQYTKEERDEVKSLDITSRLKIYGGMPETRSKLMVSRTSDLIEVFLDEYNVSNTPIIYYYKPIWEVLYAVFEYGSDEWKIGRNMEAYYQGFIAFKCDYVLNNDVELRKFVFDDGRYACVRPKDGCRYDGDCDWILWGSQCGCKGSSCIDSYPESSIKYQRDYATSRTTMHGGHDQGINLSCHYRVGVYCGCSNPYSQQLCTLWDQNLEPYTPPISQNQCHPYGEPKK